MGVFIKNEECLQMDSCIMILSECLDPYVLGLSSIL